MPSRLARENAHTTSVAIVGGGSARSIAGSLLAARVSQRFYRGQVFGYSVLERIVSLIAQNASFSDLMSDLFVGIQGYRDVRASTRLCPQ